MRTAILSILAAVAAPALPAFAQGSGGPPLSEIIAQLEADGYVIDDVDVDRDVIEIEAVAADQSRVDLRVDPQTGEILNTTGDD